ncbi:unnamed protein product [Pseudo-nitzschia multistriata]|uniref:Uncharacterized protein n=1 Tax=Pseudo-nitzschia multistriata TaxID=183589 RepID=A0A448YXA4_9STRA|nr:unnamed protein product [Pseudo-nitzschia multistriata]
METSGGLCRRNTQNAEQTTRDTPSRQQPHRNTMAEPTEPTDAVAGDRDSDRDVEDKYEYDNDEYDDDDFGDDEAPPALFRMSGVDTSLGDAFLEECLEAVLLRGQEAAGERGSDEPKLTVTLMEKDFDEKGTLLFLVSDEGGGAGGTAPPTTPCDVEGAIRDYLEASQPGDGEAHPWVGDPGAASIELVDWELDDAPGAGVDLAELGISEEEAYRLLVDGQAGDGE